MILSLPPVAGNESTLRNQSEQLDASPNRNRWKKDENRIIVRSLNVRSFEARSRRSYFERLISRETLSELGRRSCPDLRKRS